MKEFIFKNVTKFKNLNLIKHFGIILLITIFSEGCVLLRLPAVLNSRITSEVYLKINDQVMKISPGEKDGLFVTPNINPQGNEVIFHGALSGYSRIWKYSVNQKSVEALTDSSYIAVEPCFSWDGSLIAFVSDKGLEQKREDMKDISTNIFKMATMYLGGNPKILNLYVMNSDGSNLRQLTNWNAVDMRPTFSPDGKHVLFMSTFKSGTIKKRNLYKISINGDGEPQLVPNSEGANRPWYSADGKWIYFWKEIDKRGTLCKMLSDGKEWYPLKFDKGGIGSHGAFIDPTGEWLWFHSVQDKDNPINQIYKIPVDGSEIISITPIGFEREHVAHVTASLNGNFAFDVLKVLKKK